MTKAGIKPDRNMQLWLGGTNCIVSDTSFHAFKGLKTLKLRVRIKPASLLHLWNKFGGI